MDTNQILIELIQGKPLLYDRNHKFYCNITKREKAWKEIAETMNLSVPDIKKKWKYLRGHCMKILNNKLSLRSAGNGKNWKYMKDLFFLHEPRPPQSDMEEEGKEQVPAKRPRKISSVEEEMLNILKDIREKQSKVSAFALNLEDLFQRLQLTLGQRIEIQMKILDFVKSEFNIVD